MKDIIQLLPDNIANQIAAGEVIQRPASVVKELLENAIDAKASRIDVNIKDAGKTLIQVVDNGKGMSPFDAVLCFERHATSKVRSAEDLFSLTTKGFRGEALASISAIAHVEMNTRPPANDTGYAVIVEGSSIVKQEEVVCSAGTSFQVKNLFFNVPARRNFLKKESTEFRHIQDEFERIALSHPDLHLSLSHNGNQIHDLAPAILRKRIVNLLGNNWNDRLVPIEESTDIVSLKGFIIKPEYGRRSRGDQFFFVNDRYFKSGYFHNAISRAYEGLLKDGCFPGYFLYLDVDAGKIDVNVHPTKTEIKFEEEKFIYSIIYSSVKQALGKYNIAPTLEFEQETSFDIPHSMRSQPAKEPTVSVNPNFNPFETKKSGSGNGKNKENFTEAIKNQGFGSKNLASSEEWANFYSIEEEVKEENTEIEFEEINHNETNFVLKGNFIISASKSGLMLIHARRAIERITYDEISKAFVSRPIDSQTLLFPIEKEVSKNEISHWHENASLLKQLGFTGEVKDEKLLIQSVPSVLQEEVISKSVDEIMNRISLDQFDKGEIAHELIKSIASSAAMKKVNLATNENIQALIDNLFGCENHSYTPRNKKIIETILLEDLNNKFN